MTDQTTFHEKLSERDNVKAGGERSFGLVFAVVFVIVGLFPIFTKAGEEDDIRIWALVVAALFAILAMTRPQLLSPLNKIWFRFGLVIHKVVNPLVMGLIFFFVVSPIGIIMRILGKTPLKKNFDRNAKSYWIHRDPPGPAPETMKRQF